MAHRWHACTSFGARKYISSGRPVGHAGALADLDRQLAEAQAARRSLEAELRRRMRGLVAAHTPAGLNRAALYGGNLLSGLGHGAGGR